MVLITVSSPHSSHCTTPVPRFRTLCITTAIASSTVQKLAFLSCRENKKLLLNPDGCCLCRFKFIDVVLFYVYFLMIHLIFIYFSERSGSEPISALANLLKFASFSSYVWENKTRPGQSTRLQARCRKGFGSVSMQFGCFTWTPNRCEQACSCDCSCGFIAGNRLV
jgi:hypothetical protein